MEEKGKELYDLLDMSQHKNMSDKLYEKISGLIREGVLLPGYVFPNETVLCQQLNVGRSTIREAHKALELAGYISRSKKGTVVNDASVIMAATPLLHMVEQSSTEEFVEFRIMLEEETAFSAASRAVKKDIEILSGIHEELAAAAADRRFEELSGLDIRFHSEIARATHNSLFITTMTVVASVWKEQTENNFRKALLRDENVLERMITQHREILKDIEEREPEKAREHMRQHVLDMSGCLL